MRPVPLCGLQEVSDGLEPQDLFARYVRGVELEDWELWRSTFVPGAIIDASAGTGAGSRDEVAAFLEQAMIVNPIPQRFISGVEIEIEGDRASARAMFSNPMRMRGMAEQGTAVATTTMTSYAQMRAGRASASSKKPRFVRPLTFELPS